MHIDSSYEKISNAILAGVLRDDIECTGIIVTHTLSRSKWEIRFDTGCQSDLKRCKVYLLS
jgi:hypothetical protein